MSNTVTDADQLLREITHDPDATKWAKAFALTFPDNELAQDEGLMIGWFANAIMSMHDMLENGKITDLQSRLDKAEAENEMLLRMWDAYEEDQLRAAVWRMGWPEINAYHDELNKGQDIREDGGGYFMRAISRLFGLKPKRDVVTTYQDAAMAAVDQLTTKEGS